LVRIQSPRPLQILQSQDDALAAASAPVFYSYGNVDDFVAVLSSNDFSGISLQDFLLESSIASPVRDQGVGDSNPLAPTISSKRALLAIMSKGFIYA